MRLFNPQPIPSAPPFKISFTAEPVPQPMLFNPSPIEDPIFSIVFNVHFQSSKSFFI